MTIAVKNSFSIEFSNWAELTINFVFTSKTFVVLKNSNKHQLDEIITMKNARQGTTAKTALLYPKNWGHSKFHITVKVIYTKYSKH